MKLVESITIEGFLTHLNWGGNGRGLGGVERETDRQTEVDNILLYVLFYCVSNRVWGSSFA